TSEGKLDPPIVLPQGLSGLVTNVFGEGTKVKKIAISRDKRPTYLERFSADFEVDLSNSSSNVLPGYTHGFRAEVFLPDGETTTVQDSIQFDLLRGEYGLTVIPQDDGNTASTISFGIPPEMRDDFISLLEIMDQREGKT